MWLGEATPTLAPGQENRKFGLMARLHCRGATDGKKFYHPEKIQHSKYIDTVYLYIYSFNHCDVGNFLAKTSCVKNFIVYESLSHIQLFATRVENISHV